MTLVDFFFVIVDDDFRFFVLRGDNNVDDIMLFGLLPLLLLVRARIFTLRGVRDIVEGGSSSSSDDVEASRRLNDDDLLFSIIL